MDLYKTCNEQDFVREFGKAFLKAPFAKGEKNKKKLLDAIPEIKIYANLNFGFFKTGIEASVHNEFDSTIEKMFHFLEGTDKPNIVVFDEFQTVEDYPEKMPAILRTHIQKMNNTKFIFSGSERHMLDSMFNEQNKPFYKSALPMELEIIPLPVYREFCQRLFDTRCKTLTDAAVEFIYYLFSANTFEMQQAMNLAFALTAEGQAADVKMMEWAIDAILTENDSFYRELLARSTSEKERNLLQCLAVEGLASGLTSQEKIWKYNLGGASSVQASLKKLTDSKRNAVIVEIGRNHYRLQDKFFDLWLASQIGILDRKYAAAEDIFHRERAAMKELPKMASIL
ncbi:MAG: hypothetical protein J5769_01495 [Bacteroidales bacterium]|nr:hypothetical protein [Bacteroidales bacterium]